MFIGLKFYDQTVDGFKFILFSIGNHISKVKCTQLGQEYNQMRNMSCDCKDKCLKKILDPESNQNLTVLSLCHCSHFLKFSSKSVQTMIKLLHFHICYFKIPGSAQTLIFKMLS